MHAELQACSGITLLYSLPKRETMLKSALTEQLTGGAKPVEKTSAPLGLLQNPAFPCLRYAEGDVVGAQPPLPDIDAAQDEVDIPDIASVPLAGTSAPLGSVPKDKVTLHVLVIGAWCALEL